MDTRYIWGKYNISNNTSFSVLTTPLTFTDSEGEYTYETYFPYPVGDGDTYLMHPEYYNFGYAKFLSQDGGTIYYSTTASLTGKTQEINGFIIYEAKLSNAQTKTVGSGHFNKSFTIPANNYMCLNSDTFWVISEAYAQDYCQYLSDGDDDWESSLNEVILETYYDEYDDMRWKPRVIMASYTTAQYSWSFTAGSYGYGGQINTTGSESVRMPIVRGGSSAGSRVGYVSSTSRYTYPTDSISGSYWYKYITSDTIADPTAISITSNPLIAGSYANYSITSSATAGSYGSITYYIAFAYDDGSSYALMTFNTNKTGQVLLPSYATKNIRLRVYVSDGIGYTSTVNVYSQWYPISTYTSFVGVSNVAKGATSYVGVGGIAKSAIAKKGIGSNVK